MRGRRVEPSNIPMSISRGATPNTVDLEPQVLPLKGPHLYHALFENLDNPKQTSVFTGNERIAKTFVFFSWPLNLYEDFGLTCATMRLYCYYSLHTPSLRTYGTDMHDVEHKLVRNTRPSRHVKHNDTHLPSKCTRSGKQACTHHSCG
jgi:hypothetical protein